MKNLLKEKDTKLLKDFKKTDYPYLLDEDVVVELHVYDLAGNKVYSQHTIDRSTYEINLGEQGIVLPVPDATGSNAQTTPTGV